MSEVGMEELKHLLAVERTLTTHLYALLEEASFELDSLRRERAPVIGLSDLWCEEETNGLFE